MVQVGKPPKEASPRSTFYCDMINYFLVKTLESALRLICLHFGLNALHFQKIRSAQKIILEPYSCK